MLRLTRPTFTLARTRVLVSVKTHVRTYAKERDIPTGDDKKAGGKKGGGESVGKKKIAQKRLSYTPNDLPAAVQQKIVNQMQGDIIAKYTNILMKRQGTKGDVMEASQKRIVVTEEDLQPKEEEVPYDRGIPSTEDLFEKELMSPEEYKEERKKNLGMSSNIPH